MWYHIKPYLLIAGGLFAAFTAGGLGVATGVFAIMMGLMVFRLRGVI